MASILNSFSTIFFDMSLADRIWSTKTYERAAVTKSNTGVLKGEKRRELQ
jgi:hypothetical protein